MEVSPQTNQAPVDITENQLLEELYQQYNRPLLDRQHEVTARMFAVKMGLKNDKLAMKILVDEEEAGRLKSHEVRDEKGRPVRAWYRPG